MHPLYAPKKVLPASNCSSQFEKSSDSRSSPFTWFILCEIILWISYVIMTKCPISIICTYILIDITVWWPTLLLRLLVVIYCLEWSTFIGIGVGCRFLELIEEVYLGLIEGIFLFAGLAYNAPLPDVVVSRCSDFAYAFEIWVVRSVSRILNYVRYRIGSRVCRFQISWIMPIQYTAGIFWI